MLELFGYGIGKEKPYVICATLLPVTLWGSAREVPCAYSQYLKFGVWHLKNVCGRTRPERSPRIGRKIQVARARKRTAVNVS